jgi:aspartate/methionine/tyrosine aminotransferase
VRYLFIIATALLSAHDHLVVVRPNYATNLETPRTIGCETAIIDLAFEQGFRIDIDQIASAIKANTRVVSVTSPHNPTGVMMTLDELHALVALTAERGCHLLVDETYRDLSLTGALPLASTLGEHVISVSSLSKAYGAPGLRLGWIICKNVISLPKNRSAFAAVLSMNGSASKSLLIETPSCSRSSRKCGHDTHWFHNGLFRRACSNG